MMSCPKWRHHFFDSRDTLSRRWLLHLVYLLSHCIYYLLTPATKLGQNYVYTRVCDSVHRGGGSAPLRSGIHPPGRGRHPPPGSRHSPPPWSRPPQRSACWGNTGNKRTVRILLECNLVFNKLRGIVRASRSSSWTLLPRVQCTTL